MLWARSRAKCHTSVMSFAVNVAVRTRFRRARRRLTAIVTVNEGLPALACLDVVERRMTAPRPTASHLASLDVVRFAAAMAVVAFHFLYRGTVDETFTTVRFETGALGELVVEHLYLGVHLFFVVSGFVIMASVRDRDALAFAIARFVRLWPVYALCVTITAVVLLLEQDGRFPMSAATWAANLSFVAPLFGHPFADGVYWSIVLEIVFYGWVTIMIAVGVLPRHLLAFSAAWLALAGSNELFADSEALRLGFATRYAPWFLFGALMHHLVSRGSRAVALLLLLLTVALSMHNVVDEHLEVAARYGSEPAVPTVMLLNAALLLVFLAALHWRLALAPRPWLVTLGALTYPLYLLHQNIGYIVLERLSPMVGRHAALVVTVAAALIAAWAITRFFDAPARRALRRLIASLLAYIPLPGVRSATEG